MSDQVPLNDDDYFRQRSENLSENQMNQGIKDYFKELTSMYELCRLGLHRPALRIAPDSGFVRVPFATSEEMSNNEESSHNTTNLNDSIKVDSWFDEVQTHKKLRLLGRNLKSMAKVFRVLAQKVTNGYTSTLSTTAQTSLFAESSPANTIATTFNSTIIPTLSSINLDRSIFEELKPNKFDPPVQIVSQPPQSHLNPSTTTSLLTNLLTHSANIETELNLDPHHQSPTIDFSSGQPTAQILTNFNQPYSSHHSNLNPHDPFHSDPAAFAQQQNRTSLLNASIAQLTAHITTPPALFVYIIDPFDFYLFKRNSVDSDPELTEQDLKRLRHLGLFKAYLEFYNNVPDLFKYSTQFQIVPLSLCADLQQQSASVYMRQMARVSTSGANFSSCFGAGMGSGCSDYDMDFRLSALKTQAFNVFTLSKRYFMSPAHNYYLQLQQHQQLVLNTTRTKSMTGFGPAADLDKFLRENLLDTCDRKALASSTAASFNTLQHLRKLTFYSPAFILAPPTISSSTVGLAASNLFYRSEATSNSGGGGGGNASNNGPNAATAKAAPHQNNGTGECSLQMPNFIQLNMSNSNYGYLNNSQLNIDSLAFSASN